MALLGEPMGINMIRPMGALYFPVPAGVERFALQVAGAGTAETVRATVCDQAGRVAAKMDNIALPHVFLLRAGSQEGTEIWSVAFAKASAGVMEDVSIQTLGVPPVFSTTAESAFAPP